jgi:predicted alpha/beta-fold hydrolase
MQASQKSREIQYVESNRIQKSTFKPLFYLSNPHLQTILSNIVHPPFPTVTAQRLELEDGDFLDLLWSETRAPQTLLILHGLEGSVHSAYTKRMELSARGGHVGFIGGRLWPEFWLEKRVHRFLI